MKPNLRIVLAGMLALAGVAAVFALADTLCPSCQARVALAAGPQLPQVVDTVCVVDAEGTLISIVNPYPFQPENAEVLKANLRSAVNLAGRSTGRADVIEASGTIQLVDNPLPPLHGPRPPRKNPNDALMYGSGQCHTVCSCATPIYCSQAAAHPETLFEFVAKRRNPNPPGGGVCGCGGGCGSCEKCTVVCQ